MMRIISLLTLVLFWSACGSGEPPPRLSIGGVGWGDAELAVLSDQSREDLITLTAFGVAVSRGTLPDLAEPMIIRERNARLLRKLRVELSAREAGYDKARLEAAYAAAPEYELTVRHLVILSERWRPAEERERARERAAQALAEVRRGARFEDVAARYSEEPGAAERAGLLEPGRRGTWVREFWEAALALEPGGVSDVVETEYGFHVLRLEAKKPVPLAEVRYEVLARLIDTHSVAPAVDAWVAEFTAPLELDEERTLEWREGDQPDDVVLATWPGGEFRAVSLRQYLATLDAEAHERLTTSAPETFYEVVRALARNAMLIAHARDSGIELTEKEAAEAEEAILTTFREWAAALGFRHGAPPAAIKAIALDAVTSSAQRTLIARGEILAAAPAIRAFYKVNYRQDD